jgi:hypothetical protein
MEFGAPAPRTTWRTSPQVCPPSETGGVIIYRRGDNVNGLHIGSERREDVAKVTGPPRALDGMADAQAKQGYIS